MDPLIVERIISLLSPDKIILFGSQAQGAHKPESDYDLLVLIDGVVNKRKKTQQLYRDLMSFKVAVDIIIDTPGNFEKNKHEKSFIYYQINKTGRIIYEKNQECPDMD